MRINQLAQHRIAIWGLGKEGREAAHLLFTAKIPFTILDDTPTGETIDRTTAAPIIHGREAILHALTDAQTQTNAFSLIIKSPGVSLYREEITTFQRRGGIVTSLLNICLSEYKANQTSNDTIPIIAISGSKGKSTTASLLHHILKNRGRNPILVGNIGTPVSAILSSPPVTDTIIIELSSYQTADFQTDIKIDFALITALYPDHLNWHGSETTYYQDKLALLKHAHTCFAHTQVQQKLESLNITDALSLPATTHLFTHPTPWEISRVQQISPYLAREHNLNNLAGILAIVDAMGLDISRENAIAACANFQPLPHRQQDIGTKDDLLFVDDSISTTPQSAIAALDVYRKDNRPITLIAGGFDRGIDYTPLADNLNQFPINAVICLGDSGTRIQKILHQNSPSTQVFLSQSMEDAVARAQEITPKGGIVLLSPAAPSFGMFRDYRERGQAFVRAAGLLQPKKDTPS